MRGSVTFATSWVITRTLVMRRGSLKCHDNYKRHPEISQGSRKGVYDVRSRSGTST